jgi:hypothetical protein
VVSGEAGIGKTALLDAACEMAGGMRVLRVRGVESESQLPFAALVALLRPVDSSIAGISEHLAESLRGALGTGPAAPGPPLRIGVALLDLFAGVAEAWPLLVVVDDVHWIDGASAAALLFAARRLGAEGVAMLFATRGPAARMLDLGGLDEVALDGIDPDFTRLLVESVTGEDVPEDVCRRLHWAMRGNPLALIEGPAAERGRAFGSRAAARPATRG